MIVLGKNKINEKFNIDDDGVITDLNGNVQEIKLHQGRPEFKGTAVHKILMWTRFGWRDGKIWAIHHLDENKLNNNINNLEFITRKDHVSLHKKGCVGPNKNKKFTEEHKKRISEGVKGKSGRKKGTKLTEEHKNKISAAHKGKFHSEETRKKISESHKGLIPWNKGLKLK